MAMTKLLLFLLLNDVDARRHSQAFPLFKISTAGPKVAVSATIVVLMTHLTSKYSWTWARLLD